MSRSDADGGLQIAFPKSETELRVVFSHPVDRESAEDPASYKARSGLRILGGRVDPGDPRRVTLRTEPMNGEAMQLDILEAPGVRALGGARISQVRSPEFIHGLASIPELQKVATETSPFTSRFVGKVASASCGKDGGVDSNTLINNFGFAFIHMEAGGPFNSLKIVTKSHIPGIAELTRTLRAGQTAHVLWAGGEIRTVDGETQLVDTGFMEGAIIPPNPLRSPTPYPAQVAELTGKAATSLRAKSFQAVILRFERITIDSAVERTKAGRRTFTFTDASGGSLAAVALGNVTSELRKGQQFHALRALIHQPSAGRYEAIIELDQHLVQAESELFGHVTLVEGYSLPNFHGCHALVNLRDAPGKTVAILTQEHRLQTLLETALQTGALVAFWGRLMANPEAPRGGTWTVDVYDSDGIIVYDRP